MGKKSLIKSTTKKKTDAEKGEEKATKKTTAKSTPKKAAGSKKKPAAKKTKKAAATTAKKKPAAAAKKAATKKAATKKAATKKAAAKKTATKKAAPKKAATKKTTSTKPKAAPKKAKAPKKLTAKELIFKKFETALPAAEVMAAPKTTASSASAPPLITSTDPKEVARLRTVLAKQFDMAEIKAAAKAPERVAKAEKPATPTSTATAATEAPGESAPDPEPASGDAYITVDSGGPTDTGDVPMNRVAKIAAAAAAVIVFLLLAISYGNSQKYYIHPKDNAIEIWKGQFSPKLNAFYMVLHGVTPEEPIKEVYSKGEVYPLIFNYYIDKADTLLEVPGLPDYKGIMTYLNDAKTYSITSDMNRQVTARLNNIERMTLLYKADVALSKNTEDSLESAIKLLKQAGKLTPSSPQATEITQKIENARAQRTALIAKARADAKARAEAEARAKDEAKAKAKSGAKNEAKDEAKDEAK